MQAALRLGLSGVWRQAAARTPQALWPAAVAAPRPLSPTQIGEVIMLLGTWEVNLETTGRLRLPAPLLPTLAAGLVVTRGFERCLQLFPQPVWSGLAAQVNALSLGGGAERQLRRLLFASASPLVPDPAATILLGAALRDYAGIGERALLVGMDRYLEIWAPDRWQLCDAAISASAGRWPALDLAGAVTRPPAGRSHTEDYYL